jgi:hypothetical protein
MKLDISKAFDTVNWPYLLNIMGYLGFGMRWRNWIASLWDTASSSFLLNGEPGRRILHCRGVRQGDPLSPVLCLLAIEPLHKLISKAQEMNLLNRLSRGCDSFRMSLYANDDALFISTTERDFRVATAILEIFAASGLNTNFAKTEIYSINCDDILPFLHNSGMVISSFPCKYLGLPLHVRKPTKAMMQPVVQKLADMLPRWKKILLPPWEETTGQDCSVSRAYLFPNRP